VPNDEPPPDDYESDERRHDRLVEEGQRKAAMLWEELAKKGIEEEQAIANAALAELQAPAIDAEEDAEEGTQLVDKPLAF